MINVQPHLPVLAVNYLLVKCLRKNMKCDVGATVGKRQHVNEL